MLIVGIKINSTLKTLNDGVSNLKNIKKLLFYDLYDLYLSLIIQLIDSNKDLETLEIISSNLISNDEFISNISKLNNLKNLYIISCDSILILYFLS